MAKLLLPVLLSCVSLSVFGQAPQRDSARAGARVEVRYVDTKGKKLPSADGADHRIETSYIDSVKGSVRVFYPAGQLKSYTPYVNIRRHFRHGRFLEYYETGQLHLQEDFVANKRQGDFLVYYPDGTLRRRDHYEADKRTAGECFGVDGHAVDYFEYEQYPKYLEGDGGVVAIVTAIQQRIRYPKSALRHQLVGKIKVRFIVNTLGEVQNVSIVEGVDESKFEGLTLAAVRDLEVAVVQAVYSLKHFIPARRDGESIDFSYQAPISFSIR